MGARKRLTLSSFAQEQELAWWSWDWKWAAVGPKRLGRSSRCWRKHVRDQIPLCYCVAWSKRGGCGGTPSCRVRQPGRLQLPCWNSEEGHGADGVTPPSFEVERDQRYAGLCG